MTGFLLGIRGVEIQKTGRRSLQPNIIQSGRCRSRRLAIFGLKDVKQEGVRRKQDNRAQEQRDDKQAQRCDWGGTIIDGDVRRD